MIYSLFLLVAAGMAAALPAVAQQPPSPEYLAAQTVAAASWPHTTQRDGATVTVYQPQAIAWPERRQRICGPFLSRRGCGDSHAAVLETIFGRAFDRRQIRPRT